MPKFGVILEYAIGDQPALHTLVDSAEEAYRIVKGIAYTDGVVDEEGIEEYGAERVYLHLPSIPDIEEVVYIKF